MRDPIAPFLGSIHDDAPIVEGADAGLLMDALLSPASRWTDPASVADLVAMLAVPGMASAEIGEAWPCNDYPSATAVVGLVAVDLVPAEDLTVSIPGQRAIGLWNGNDLHSHRAIEVADTGGAGFYAPLVTQFNPGVADFGILHVFRISQRSSAQSSLIGHASTGHAAGFAIYTETDGTLTWRVRGTGGDRTRTLGGNHADGAWHFIAAYRSGGTIGVYSDLTAEATTAGATGDVSSGGFASFGIGEVQSAAPGAWQQAKLVVYLTSAVLAGQRAALLAWWTSAVTRPPASVAFARASSLSSQVGVDSVGGIEMAIAAVGAPAPMWMPSAADGNFGLELAPAYTSIVQYSDPSDTAGWTRRSTPLVEERIADCPRGTRSALRLGKVAGNPTGRLSLDVALTNGSLYTFAIALRWIGSGPLPPTLRIRDAADTTTLVTVAATNATGAWHWLQLSYTAASTATHRLEILASPAANDTADAGVWVQYALGGLGSSRQPLPALARGSTVANVVTTLSITPADLGLIGRAAAGRIEVTAAMIGVANGLPAERALATLIGGSMVRRLSVTAARVLRVLVLDDAGGTDVSLAAATLTTAELAEVHRWAARWQRAVASGVTVTAQKDGVDVETSVTAIDAATDPASLAIGGSSLVGALSWLGGISRVRVYAVPWMTQPPVFV